MIFRWIGKHVDLELLAKRIEEFLVNKEFKTSKETSNSQISFLATKKYENLTLTILVAIKGKPDDLLVDIAPIVSESTRFLTQFLTIFGLGAFALKRIRLREIYDRFEEDFLSYLERSINDLVGSAKN